MIFMRSGTIKTTKIRTGSYNFPASHPIPNLLQENCRCQRVWEVFQRWYASWTGTFLWLEVWSHRLLKIKLMKSKMSQNVSTRLTTTTLIPMPGMRTTGARDSCENVIVQAAALSGNICTCLEVSMLKTRSSIVLRGLTRSRSHPQLLRAPAARRHGTGTWLSSQL